MGEAINSIEPFRRLFDEDRRPLTIAFIATAGACVAGANVYGAMYKPELVEQVQIADGVSALDRRVQTMTAEDRQLTVAEHNLAKYGIHDSEAAVHRAIDANLGRIRVDQTKTAALQREYPKLPPAVAFDMTPIVLGFVGLGTYLALWVRRQRKADAKTEAASLTESQSDTDV